MQMSFLDDISNVAFKTDANGSLLFFPWGFLGVGYIVESKGKRDEIRQFYKKLYLITPPFVLIVLIFHLFISFYIGMAGFFYFLILFAIYLGLIYINIKKLTRNLPVSKESLSIAESFTNAAKPHRLVTLMLLEGISLLLLAGAVAALLMGLNIILCLGLIGVFVFCALAVAYWIGMKVG
jgi:hypothetical protein